MFGRFSSTVFAFVDRPKHITCMYSDVILASSTPNTLTTASMVRAGMHLLISVRPLPIIFMHRSVRHVMRGRTGQSRVSRNMFRSSSVFNSGPGKTKQTATQTYKYLSVSKSAQHLSSLHSYQQLQGHLIRKLYTPKSHGPRTWTKNLVMQSATMECITIFKKKTFLWICNMYIHTQASCNVLNYR